MIRAVVAAVLATMLIAGTAIAQEEEMSFRDALTEYTVSQALVSAAWDEAQFNGYEGLSQQALETAVGDALDRWQPLVVESCAADWHTVVEVYWMLQVAIFREIGSETGSELIDAIAGIGTLVDYYQTNATVACGLS